MVQNPGEVIKASVDARQNNCYHFRDIFTFMKKFFLIFLLGVIFSSSTVFAQAGQYSEKFYRAEVVKILSEGEKQFAGYGQKYQSVELEISEGERSGEKLTVEYGGEFSLTDQQKVLEGDDVVVSEKNLNGSIEYSIVDKYRLPALIWIFVGFLLLSLIFSRWKGFGSLIGLILSIFILIKFIVPSIAAGNNPVWVSLLGTLMIAVPALYLAHGFNKRTSIALLGTILTIFLATLLALIAVDFAHVFGTGSEDAMFLQFGPLENINLKGLLLGGIIIGTLGVLDDITTAQSAVVDELKKANPKLKFKELYRQASSVGREHIASLINTLVLAYAGASLPLFLLFTLDNNQPFWLILNNEFIAEEIVRTLVGSMALVLAVPITTVLAAYFIAKPKKNS